MLSMQHRLSILLLVFMTSYTLNVCSVNGQITTEANSKFHFNIMVKKGDWVEYAVVDVIEKAAIPIEFNGTFPKNWTTVNVGNLIKVFVLEKIDVDFSNYSREFAVFNVTFNDHSLIPFWFFETIRSIRQLPIDGFSFFLPTNETYWEYLKEQIESLAEKIGEFGVLITYNVKKCFYRLRADSAMFGWAEISANFDKYCGVLIDFSFSFCFNHEIISEINRRVGRIFVDGQPFEIEPNKRYGVSFSFFDSNIPQLINSAKFGEDVAEDIDWAVKNRNVGSVITVKLSPEGNDLIKRTIILVEPLDASIALVKDHLIVNVDADSNERKTFVVYIDRKAFSVHWMEELRVLVDGKFIIPASSYVDVLNPYDDKEPEYYIITGSELIQVIISLPSLSSHVIEIVKAPSLIMQFAFYLTIAALTFLVIFGALILRRRARKSRQLT
ncbi:MAG: hypothetical protein QW279_11690 [Candidatus Jordarchaeaceae archaeon]